MTAQLAHRVCLDLPAYHSRSAPFPLRMHWCTVCRASARVGNKGAASFLDRTMRHPSYLSSYTEPFVWNGRGTWVACMRAGGSSDASRGIRGVRARERYAIPVRRTATLGPLEFRNANVSELFGSGMSYAHEVGGGKHGRASGRERKEHVPAMRRRPGDAPAVHPIGPQGLSTPLPELPVLAPRPQPRRGSASGAL
jgi:hypothetical protein